MKARWIILIGFLFLVAQPFFFSATAKTSPVKTASKENPPKNQGSEISRLNFPNNHQKLAGIATTRIPSVSKKGIPLKGYVVFVQGEVKARIGGKGRWIPLRIGDAVPPQSDLKTGEESTLEVKYEDGSSFLLRSDTQVKIIQTWKTANSRLLRDFFLSAGRFIAKVREATGQTLRFRVHTPSAIASVRGTEFRVSVDQKQKTFVEVLKRRVTVDTAQKSIDLVQGEGAMVKILLYHLESSWRHRTL
jgi:hypothetical protein